MKSNKQECKYESEFMLQMYISRAIPSLICQA